MKNFLLFVSAFMLGSSLAYAQSSSKLELGTPQSLLNSIRNGHSRSASSFELPLSATETAAITIENYYEGADRLSMNGVSQTTPNSLFILKGDASALSGYLVIHDTRKAYEITTENGIVSITEADIARFFPDIYEPEMKPPVSQTLAPTVVYLPVYSSMAKRQVIHIGPYNNEDVTKLQSKPGSPYVFYLNNTAVMNGTTPKNNRGKEEMYRVWQCTADQYSMLNLNITTDVSVYNAAKSADVTKTGVIKFVDADGRSNAPVASFGTTSAGTLYRNPLGSGNDYGYGIGMTCAHEVGHQMGMNHDGGTAQADPEYFEGLPKVQWCPIMGNYWFGASWNNQLFTWSKGEYNTSTNKEDDFKIMTVNEKVPYMTDDIPTSKALKVSSSGVIAPDVNWGQIERNTDSDTFTFEVGSSGGKIDLRIDPLEYLRQLDVAAKIVDASGTTIASSNLQVNRSAEFKAVSLQPGKYSLIIQGGAELTPQTGFSNYSSLGYYGMEGTLTGAVITSIDKASFENTISVYPNPTADLLNISYGFNNPSTQVSLLTITGQTIYESNQMVQTINLSDFAKGVYFLRITSNGESCVKKVYKY